MCYDWLVREMRWKVKTHLSLWYTMQICPHHHRGKKKKKEKEANKQTGSLLDHLKFSKRIYLFRGEGNWSMHAWGSESICFLQYFFNPLVFIVSTCLWIIYGSNSVFVENTKLSLNIVHFLFQLKRLTSAPETTMDAIGTQRDIWRL